MVRGKGDNFHEGRMLPCIYDEPLTGSNSAAFKCVEACHCQGISILSLAINRGARREALICIILLFHLLHKALRKE